MNIGQEMEGIIAIYIDINNDNTKYYVMPMGMELTVVVDIVSRIACFS